MTVNVKDHNGNPLKPTKPARARLLVNQGKAEVVCKKPFTIQLINKNAHANENTPDEPQRSKRHPGYAL